MFPLDPNQPALSPREPHVTRDPAAPLNWRRPTARQVSRFLYRDRTLERNLNRTRGDVDISDQD
jgi:hypothetical protein